MATFEALNRLEWEVTMTLAEGAISRDLTVCDDGWKIWLKGEEGQTLFTISNDNMRNRQPDRESAMARIRAHCGWWSNNQEMFTVHPNMWGGRAYKGV